MSSLSEVLDVPILTLYQPYFVTAGFDDFDYLMSENKDGWNSMLDIISEKVKKDGMFLKPGHRMMILSRLRKAQVAQLNRHEEDQEQNQRTVHLEKQERNAKQPFRPPESSIHSPFLPGLYEQSNISILWDGIPCVNAHWICQLGTLVLILGSSLLLWSIEESFDTQLGDDAEIEGGWLFLRTVYIIGFIITSILFIFFVLAYIRRENSAPMTAPNCPSCFPSTAILGSAGALSCCSFDSSRLCLDCSQCTLPSCSCANVSCGAVESCCLATYKIICCKCSITIE